MQGQKWTIYWSEYASDTYLYGSKVLFHKKDDVEFVIDATGNYYQAMVLQNKFPAAANRANAADYRWRE